MKLVHAILVVCMIVHQSENTNASIIAVNGAPLVVASFSEPIASPNRVYKDGISSSVPLFYGWFYNESTAESMSMIGKKYFLSAYDKIPEFQQFINELMLVANVSNPLEFYKKPLDPDSGKLDLTYHTTAKFCGRSEDKPSRLEEEDSTDECNQYLEEIGQYLGRPYRMHFVGLFFTNYTYGIRVKLTAEEQKLFREDTRENSAQRSETEPDNDIEIFGQDGHHKDHFSYEPYYYLHKSQDVGKSSLFYPGIKFQPQPKNFHPTESRSHVTLGCAPGIPAVQTGLDLLNIVDLEVSSFAHHDDFSVGGGDIPKAVLREIKVGNELGRYAPVAFVVYPEDEMIADAIFDAYL